MLSTSCFSEFEVTKCSINRRLTRSSRQPSPILRCDVHTCVLSIEWVQCSLTSRVGKLSSQTKIFRWIFNLCYDVVLQHWDSVKLLQIWGSSNKVTGRMTGSTDIGHVSHSLPRVTKWISFKSTFSHNFLGSYMLTLVSKSPFMTPKQFFKYIFSPLQNGHALSVR